MSLGGCGRAFRTSRLHRVGRKFITLQSKMTLLHRKQANCIKSDARKGDSHLLAVDRASASCKHILTKQQGDVLIDQIAADVQQNSLHSQRKINFRHSPSGLLMAE